MVLALDLLILFLFSIYILSISQTAENVQGCERCRRGEGGDLESINWNIKSPCVCALCEVLSDHHHLTGLEDSRDPPPTHPTSIFINSLLFFFSPFLLILTTQLVARECCAASVSALQGGGLIRTLATQRTILPSHSSCLSLSFPRVYNSSTIMSVKHCG